MPDSVDLNHRPSLRTRYVEDIYAQPQALRGILASYAGRPGLLAELKRDWLRAGRPLIVMTGMGASLTAAKVAGIYLLQRGILSMAVPTSTLLADLWPSLPKDALLVVISQSGESVEIKSLIGWLEKRRMVAVTNVAESTLTKASQRSLQLGVTPDLSVAVKTYTGTVGLLLLLAAYLSGSDANAMAESLSRAADAIETWLPRWEEQAEELAAALGRPRFANMLGLSVGEATADEAALLFKEGAKLPAEAMGAAQFRHGAVEVVDREHVAFYFIPPAPTAAREMALAGAEELLGLGGRVVTIGPKAPEGSLRPFAHVQVPDIGNSFANAVVEIVPVQVLVAYLAHAGNLEAGAFRNTTPVISHGPLGQ